MIVDGLGNVYPTIELRRGQRNSVWSSFGHFRVRRRFRGAGVGNSTESLGDKRSR